MDVVCFVLRLYTIVIVLRIILGMIVSFGNIPWGHPVRQGSDMLGKAVDPLLSPIRRVIPGVPLGTVHLDLSPLILIVGLSIFTGIICPN